MLTMSLLKNANSNKSSVERLAVNLKNSASAQFKKFIAPSISKKYHLAMNSDLPRLRNGSARKNAPSKYAIVTASNSNPNRNALSVSEKEAWN